MSESATPVRFGWMHEYPSILDYTPEHEVVKPLLAKLKPKAGKKEAPLTVPASVDLRAWFSPIENQLNLGSCTVNVGVGLLEYYERRAYGKHIDASRFFLYKTSRDLLKWTGDTGAYLRTTLQALALFGVPPEEYWPYDVSKFDVEPSAFLYSFAGNYKALSYYRLDPSGTTPTALLARIKSNLAAGLPAFFGFTVYNSYVQASAANKGAIPFPVATDRVVGGHAVVAAGYDDNVKIKNSNAGGATTTGALLIRNSWGTGWGDGGYGWLPYDYVQRGIATDWWSLISAGWVNTGNFG